MKLCEWHQKVSLDLIEYGATLGDAKRAVAVMARACRDCDTSRTVKDDGPDTTGYMGGV